MNTVPPTFEAYDMSSLSFPLWILPCWLAGKGNFPGLISGLGDSVLIATAGCSCVLSSAAVFASCICTVSSFQTQPHFTGCFEFFYLSPPPVLQTDAHLILTLSRLCALCTNSAGEGIGKERMRKQLIRGWLRGLRPTGYVIGLELLVLGWGQRFLPLHAKKAAILQKKRILCSSLKPSSQATACLNTPTSSHELCSIPTANRSKKTTTDIGT